MLNNTAEKRDSRWHSGGTWLSSRNQQRAGNDVVKQFLHVMLRSLGVNSIFRRGTRRHIRVIRYHGVAKDNWNWAEGNSLQVKESEFRKQMLYLKRYFEVVSLDSVLSSVSLSEKPRAVITFDDGYANNFTVAFPILRELRLPATVFLVTAFLDCDWIFWYDRLFLALGKSADSWQYRAALDHFKGLHPHRVDEEVDKYLYAHGCNTSAFPPEFVSTYRTLRRDEVAEMGRSGLITFGSHMHRHELLTRMALGEAKESLRQSLLVLEELPGNIPFFCYPNGWYEREHIALVEALGFRGAVTTREGLWREGECEYEIPRVGIGRRMRIASFAGYLSGSLLSLRKLWCRRKHGGR